MKKILAMAVLFAFSAALSTANAGGKKDKKKTQKKAMIMSTPSDSLSYIAGMATTNGLDTYLKQQYGIDQSNMNDFMRGLKEGIENSGNTGYKAYAAGLQIASMLEERIYPSIQKEFAGTPDSISKEFFTEGFMASMNKDNSQFTDSAALAIFTARRLSNKAAKDEQLYGQNRRDGEKWLEDNAKKEGVVTLPSGLQYKIITKGEGAIPQRTDRVIVKYEGKTIDGTVFDSSYKRDPQTSTFRADQVIKGWTEALTIMPVGSKWELYIPQQLAYGERQAGKIKPYSMLIFTVELIDIEQPEGSKTVDSPKSGKPVVLKKNAKK